MTLETLQKSNLMSWRKCKMFTLSCPKCSLSTSYLLSDRHKEIRQTGRRSFNTISSRDNDDEDDGTSEKLAWWIIYEISKRKICPLVFVPSQEWISSFSADAKASRRAHTTHSIEMLCNTLTTSAPAIAMMGEQLRGRRKENFQLFHYRIAAHPLQEKSWKKSFKFHCSH